jgi:pyocin large subunit-like protein
MTPIESNIESKEQFVTKQQAPIDTKNRSTVVTKIAKKHTFDEYNDDGSMRTMFICNWYVLFFQCSICFYNFLLGNVVFG